MSVQTLSRCGAALFLAALISGCSLLGFGDSGTEYASASPITDQCRWNRSSCIYEGKYEPNERDYAEEEAKRLNRIASERLSRNAIR